jgi:hypothetical protein
VALALSVHAGVAWAQEPAPAAASKPTIVLPVPISDLTARYPEGAKGDAVVVLTLVIGPDGSVKSAAPNERNEPFSNQAVVSSLDWRFQPATRDGVPMTVRIRVEVRFVQPEPPPEPPPEPAATKPEEPGQKATQSAHAKTPRPKQIEIDVYGVKPEPSRTATLSRAEVRQIPGTFGDPFRAIEVMPGVTPIISGLPFFFVRGAPPGDVGYFVDGIRIPVLYHVGAGPAVIHPALIDRVDLYPGGYPARFGRFSGGIVDGETAPPASDLHGEYNVRIFDAGALVETPFDDHRGSVLLAGRYSYTAELLTLLQSNVVLNYWDYQARVGYALTPKDTVSTFVFGSDDFLGQRGATGVVPVFGSEFHRADVRYDHRLEHDGNLRFATTLGEDLSELPDTRFIRDRLLGTRVELAQRIAPGALFRLGTDVQLDTYDVKVNLGDFNATQAAAAALFPTRSDLAAGVRSDVVLDLGPRLTVTPGIRVDYFTSEGASAIGVDPRFATRLAVNKQLALLSTFGLAHQPPAFIVPLPGFQPGGLRGGLQLAVQESAGIEYDFGHATKFTATVFHNGFFNMSDPLSVTQREASGCLPGQFPADTLGGDFGGEPRGRAPCGLNNRTPGQTGADNSGGGGGGANNTLKELAVRSNGAAYGLELYLKKDLTSRLGGFASYTLSRSVRTLGNQEFIAMFDRTHVINGALAYNLGRNWRAGTRVTFYTGLPKAPDPTDPTSTRLPPFFRLDLRLEKRWQFSKKVWLSFVAEWLNATLSKEAVSTTCNINGCQTQTVGPITIPSLGIEGGF